MKKLKNIIYCDSYDVITHHIIMNQQNQIRISKTIKYYPNGSIKSIKETHEYINKEQKICNKYDSYANSLGIPPKNDKISFTNQTDAPIKYRPMYIIMSPNRYLY